MFFVVNCSFRRYNSLVDVDTKPVEKYAKNDAILSRDRRSKI
jgi:hypothetical protein